MKNQIALYFVFISLLGNVANASETKFLKDLDINMTFEEMNQAVNRNPAACTNPIAKCFIVYQTEKYSTIADVPVRFLHFKYDENNSFNSLWITFGSESYSDVKNAYASKYKFSCTISTLQNMLGAQFPQETCIASNGKFLINISRYTRKVDESIIEFKTDVGIKNELNKIKNKSVKAQKDI